MQNQLLEAVVEADESDPALGALEGALTEVQGMIDTIKANLGKKIGTSGDFCKLIQMRMDLQNAVSARNIKEITVTWQDPEYLKN